MHRKPPQGNKKPGFKTEKEKQNWNRRNIVMEGV